MNHIATNGDPFEMGSARPLDFGHWVAHKLEQISDFRVGHGEAVAIGLAVDLTYSARVGLLKPETSERIISLLQKLGFELFDDLLLADNEDGERIILEGLEEFREHLGGQLTITLLRAIGEGFEVHKMNTPKVLAAIHELRARHETEGDQKIIPANG